MDEAIRKKFVTDIPREATSIENTEVVLSPSESQIRLILSSQEYPLGIQAQRTSFKKCERVVMIDRITGLKRRKTQKKAVDIFEVWRKYAADTNQEVVDEGAYAHFLHKWRRKGSRKATIELAEDSSTSLVNRRMSKGIRRESLLHEQDSSMTFIDGETVEAKKVKHGRQKVKVQRKKSEKIEAASTPVRYVSRKKSSFKGRRTDSRTSQVNLTQTSVILENATDIEYMKAKQTSVDAVAKAPAWERMPAPSDTQIMWRQMTTLAARNDPTVSEKTKSKLEKILSRSYEQRDAKREERAKWYGARWDEEDTARLMEDVREDRKQAKQKAAKDTGSPIEQISKDVSATEDIAQKSGSGLVSKKSSKVLKVQEEQAPKRTAEVESNIRNMKAQMKMRVISRPMAQMKETPVKEVKPVAISPLYQSSFLSPESKLSLTKRRSTSSDLDYSKESYLMDKLKRHSVQTPPEMEEFREPIRKTSLLPEALQSLLRGRTTHGASSLEKRGSIGATPEIGKHKQDEDKRFRKDKKALTKLMQASLFQAPPDEHEKTPNLEEIFLEHVVHLPEEDFQYALDTISSVGTDEQSRKSSQGMSTSSTKSSTLKPVVEGERSRAGKKDAQKRLRARKKSQAGTGKEVRRKSRARKKSSTPASDSDSRRQSDTPTGGMDSKRQSATPEVGLDSKRQSLTPTVGMDSKRQSATPVEGMDSKRKSATPTVGMDSKRQSSATVIGIDSRRQSSTTVGGIDSRRQSSTPVLGKDGKRLKLPQIVTTDSKGLVSSLTAQLDALPKIRRKKGSLEEGETLSPGQEDEEHLRKEELEAQVMRRFMSPGQLASSPELSDPSLSGAPSAEWRAKSGSLPLLSPLQAGESRKKSPSFQFGASARPMTPPRQRSKSRPTVASRPAGELEQIDEQRSSVNTMGSRSLRKKGLAALRVEEPFSRVKPGENLMERLARDPRVIAAREREKRLLKLTRKLRRESDFASMSTEGGVAEGVVESLETVIQKTRLMMKLTDKSAKQMRLLETLPSIIDNAELPNKEGVEYAAMFGLDELFEFMLYSLAQRKPENALEFLINMTRNIAQQMRARKEAAAMLRDSLTITESGGTVVGEEDARVEEGGNQQAGGSSASVETSSSAFASGSEISKSGSEEKH